MGKYRKIIVAILTFMLVFALVGCKSKTEDKVEENVDTGELTTVEVLEKSYMEVKLPDEISKIGIKNIRSNSKGEVIVYYEKENGGGKGYLKLDSKGQQIGEMTVDFSGDGSNFTFDKDDNMYVMHLDLGQVEASSIDSKYQLLKGKFGEDGLEEMPFSLDVVGALSEVREELIVKIYI